MWSLGFKGGIRTGWNLPNGTLDGTYGAVTTINYGGITSGFGPSMAAQVTSLVSPTQRVPRLGLQIGFQQNCGNFDAGIYTHMDPALRLNWVASGQLDYIEALNEFNAGSFCNPGATWSPSGAYGVGMYESYVNQYEVYTLSHAATISTGVPVLGMNYNFYAGGNAAAVNSYATLSTYTTDASARAAVSPSYPSPAPGMGSGFSAYMDAANFHLYPFRSAGSTFQCPGGPAPSAGNASNGGNGMSTPSEIWAYSNLCFFQSGSVNNGFSTKVIGETGWTISAAYGGASPSNAVANAHTISQLFLENQNNGIARTYYYELLGSMTTADDQGYALAVCECHTTPIAITQANLSTTSGSPNIKINYTGIGTTVGASGPIVLTDIVTSGSFKGITWNGITLSYGIFTATKVDADNVTIVSRGGNNATGSGAPSSASLSWSQPAYVSANPTYTILPEGLALANLSTLYSDTGTNTTNKQLSYAYSCGGGCPSTLHTALHYNTSTNKFYLAFWNAVENSDQTQSTQNYYPPASGIALTVNFGTAVNYKVYNMGDPTTVTDNNGHAGSLSQTVPFTPVAQATGTATSIYTGTIWDYVTTLEISGGPQ
jgi:hypothetical protein